MQVAYELGTKLKQVVCTFTLTLPPPPPPPLFACFCILMDLFSPGINANVIIESPLRSLSGYQEIKPFLIRFLLWIVSCSGQVLQTPYKSNQRSCSMKKVFLNIYQNSHENQCRSLFLIKLDYDLQLSIKETPT